MTLTKNDMTKLKNWSFWAVLFFVAGIFIYKGISGFVDLIIIIFDLEWYQVIFFGILIILIGGLVKKKW